MLAVIALPIAAAGRAGFTVVYLLQLLAIPLILHAARHITESPRFLVHASEPHRYRDVIGGIYRRRLLMLGGATFLGAAFTAPTLEFTTRYLHNARFTTVDVDATAQAIVLRQLGWRFTLAPG